jgi:hypothetical protein
MNEMNDLAPGCSLVLDVMSVCKHDPDYTKPYDPDYTKPHHNSDWSINLLRIKPRHILALILNKFMD